MKVLFLDFDGPLFTDRMIQLHPANRTPYPGFIKRIGHKNDLSYWKMDEVSVDILNSLYNMYPFQTVVSSSWKGFCSKELVEELFLINRLELKLHEDWSTPNITFRSCRRIEEIADWLDNHLDVDDCIVIDDRESGHSIASVIDYRKHYRGDKPDIYPRIQNIELVHTDTGLTVYNYTSMHKVLRVWAGEDPKVIEAEEQKRFDLLSAFLC